MFIEKVSAQMNIKKPDTIQITDIGQLISALVGTVLIIAALLAFLYLILGGIKWITSGGDKAGMEEARNELADLKMKDSMANPRAYDMKRVENEIEKLNGTLKTVRITRVKIRDLGQGDN